MRTPSYDAYIHSAEWAARRKRALEVVGYRCQGCSGTERLEVHHLTYERLGFERPTDLQVLCHWCHMGAHGRAATGFPAVQVPLPVEQHPQRQLARCAPVVARIVALREECRTLAAATVVARARKRAKLCASQCDKLIDEVLEGSA